MALSVLVPYRAGEPYRDRAWEWNRQRWEATGHELIVESPGPGKHPGQFNHPKAINAAARKATGDMFLVADADTAFDPDWVNEAAALNTWVLPRHYDSLTRRSSDAILNQAPTDPIGDYKVKWRGTSISWAGLVVIPRDAFELVGGYDERFISWGGDDICFSRAITMLYGEATRVEGAAIHFWHPQPRSQTYGHPDHPTQHALMVRYCQAQTPDEMRAVMAG